MLPTNAIGDASPGDPAALSKRGMASLASLVGEGDAGQVTASATPAPEAAPGKGDADGSSCSPMVVQASFLHRQTR